MSVPCNPSQVIVYKGRSTIIYQSGGYSCAGRMVHMFPGWWPGFDAPAAKAQCDALVRKVVKTMRVHNHILGVQVSAETACAAAGAIHVSCKGWRQS